MYVSVKCCIILRLKIGSRLQDSKTLKIIIKKRYLHTHSHCQQSKHSLHCSRKEVLTFRQKKDPANFRNSINVLI